MGKGGENKEFVDEDEYYGTTDDDDDDEEEEEVEKWKKHYSSKQRILLVGEGDFSFSLCLAREFGSAHNMVATSLDTQENIGRKYSNGLGNVRELEERGCLVLYGVDAKQMSNHFFLRTQKFDRIIYNFPHVGFIFPENSYCQIQLNKGLVKGFLRNAKLLLKEKGEIHVSHKEGDPYNKWELVKKAEKIGLILHEVVPFCKQDYPGYDNKRAQGNLSDDSFRLGDCSTYKFGPLTPSPKFAQNEKVFAEACKWAVDIQQINIRILLKEPLLGYKHKRIEEQQPPEIKHNLEKDRAVERKIGEFTSAVSRFESRVQMQYNIPKPPSVPEPVSQAEQSSYKNEILELKGIIEFLHQLMKKRRGHWITVREKNEALENRTSELGPLLTIRELQ